MKPGDLVRYREEQILSEDYLKLSGVVGIIVEEVKSSRSLQMFRVLFGSSQFVVMREEIEAFDGHR